MVSTFLNLVRPTMLVQTRKHLQIDMRNDIILRLQDLIGGRDLSAWIETACDSARMAREET